MSPRPAADFLSVTSLENLYRHYLQCRRNKRNALNALRFEARKEQHLLALQEALVNHTYAPARSVCFVVQRPKLREIFAADFRDRIVHHVLVSALERAWEPIFIHDSYACRKGKGVHAGVDRLQQFIRQVTHNGTRRAGYSVRDGVDFLGYIVRGDYRLVRRRVVNHLHERLRDYQTRLVVERLTYRRYHFDQAVLDPIPVPPGAREVGYLGRPDRTLPHRH